MLNGYELLRADLSFESWERYTSCWWVFAQFGIATDEDMVPTSKQAKLVSQINLEKIPRRARGNPPCWWNEDVLVNTTGVVVGEYGAYRSVMLLRKHSQRMTQHRRRGWKGER